MRSALILTLAFLPLADVMDSMAFVTATMPTGEGLEALADLVDYFDATYVFGSARRVQHPATSHRIQRVRLILPLCPPAVWNTYDITLVGTDRTNNSWESWNNAFASLVGCRHPSLWTLLEALQQDEALSVTAIEVLRGHLIRF